MSTPSPYILTVIFTARITNKNKAILIKNNIKEFPIALSTARKVYFKRF